MKYLDSMCNLSGMNIPPGQVTPKTFIKIEQTASLHGTKCVRVGVWQCSPTIRKAG